MSIDLWFTIRENKKTNHIVDTLFFGKQEVYDYKRFVEKVFATYDEALKFIIDNDLSFKNVHIRKSYDFGGGVTDKDYIYKIGRR